MGLNGDFVEGHPICPREIPNLLIMNTWERFIIRRLGGGVRRVLICVRKLVEIIALRMNLHARLKDLLWEASLY